jgi:hypothetical protein
MTIESHLPGSNRCNATPAPVPLAALPGFVSSSGRCCSTSCHPGRRRGRKRSSRCEIGGTTGDTGADGSRQRPARRCCMTNTVVVSAVGPVCGARMPYGGRTIWGTDAGHLGSSDVLPLWRCIRPASSARQSLALCVPPVPISRRLLFCPRFDFVSHV